MAKPENTPISWAEFGLGFWHTFGPYSGRTADAILEWKAAEVERYGWTLWSFAAVDLTPWLGVLSASTGPIYVLCSDSPGARDRDVDGPAALRRGLSVR
jgi:hypothetical protein